MIWDISVLKNLSFALNVTFGSLLIIVLMLVNYLSKYNPDHFQRSIFCSLLVFYVISMISDFLVLLFQGVPEKHIPSLLYIFSVSYYFSRIFCYYYIAIFVDYMAFREKQRTNRIILFSYLFFVLYGVFLLLGSKHGLYFVIDSENILHRGSHFYIRYIVGYLPLLLALGEIILFRSLFKHSYFTSFVILLVFFCTGSIADFLFLTTRLVWPWETVALLYSYFFIVQSYVRIDPLTDISNRLSFNEFTDSLSRHHSGESWAMVMLDMDHFKMINDTLGHQEGDRALCDMAVILKTCVKGNDFVARYGGDEFVLAVRVEKDGKDKISKLMNEIQTMVDQFNAKQIRPFKLEISYGYDVYTADGGQSMEEFLNYIDSLMYKHKQERRRSGDKKEEAAG